jgi:hypothetical protein
MTDDGIGDRVGDLGELVGSKAGVHGNREHFCGDSLGNGKALAMFGENRLKMGGREIDPRFDARPQQLREHAVTVSVHQAGVKRVR